MSDVTRILAQVAAKHDVGREELQTGKRFKSLCRPRNEAAYRFYTETQYSQADIAHFLGMRDHTAVRHMILTHAQSIGRNVSRVSELRDGNRPNAIDWTAFGYAFADWMDGRDLTQHEAAARIGVSRSTVRKARNGERLDADTYVLIRARADLDETLFVRLPAASRETPVKHDAGRAAHG